MALRCSLLGHTFEEATVQREREERGSEVVTVVREVEQCSQCGEKRVISENKEVTSVVEPHDVGLDDREVQGAGSFNDDEFEPADSPEEEDAEILEDTHEREPGEWPEEPGGATDEPPVEEGEPDLEDRGDDHATVLDDEGDADVDRAQASLDDAQPGGTADPTPEPGESTVVDRDLGESLTVPEGSLACPECGLEVDADSSFRAGDACPECQRGYLEQVE